MKAQDLLWFYRYARVLGMSPKIARISAIYNASISADHRDAYLSKYAQYWVKR